MSLIGEVLNRLKLDFPETRSDVARSLNSPPVGEEISLPSVFVHYMDSPETPPNETIQVVTQRIKIRFAVMIFARNYSQSTGTDELEDARHAIFSSLLGFEPSGYEPIEYVAGGIVPEAYTGTRICWREVYQSYQYLRSERS